MKRIVHEDLGLKSYKQHLISANSKKKRLERGKKMLKKIRSAGNKVIIWSDEKIFTVEARANSQNDRILSRSPEDVPFGDRAVFHRQKPAGVMEWAAVASNGSKSPKRV